MATVRTTPGQWFAGARPRTLPAAVAPVLVGTAIAAWEASIIWGRALLALVVALALQMGVNYANDYSDGIRGTDAVRVGPVRLVGQGLATPRSVRRAAFASFAVAAIAGLFLVVMSGQFWLLLVGAAAIIAAWTYTGGPRPYGYAGLGEVFVFVFFGLVAVGGTALVQVGHLSGLSLLLGAGVGFLASAILVANNLRDIPGDTVAGKMTLAVRLGDPRTRTLYQVLVIGSLQVALAVGLTGLSGLGGLGGLGSASGWPVGAAVGTVALLPAVPALKAVRANASGAALVPVLIATGRVLLVYGVALSSGILLSALLSA